MNKFHSIDSSTSFHSFARFAGILYRNDRFGSFSSSIFVENVNYHPLSTIFISSLWRGAEVILPSSPTLIEFYCIDRIYEHFIALYERISIRCVTLNRMSYLTFAFDEEKELICICDLSISMNYNNFIQFFSYIFFPIIYAFSCSFLIIFMHFGI